MNVLGLGTEGDSGAAIVEDGRILAAVNEERLCRMKLVAGFPRGSIREVFRLTGIEPGDLDAVLIAGKDDLLVDHLEPFDGWFQYRPQGLAGMIKRSAHRFSQYRDRFPLLESGYYALLTPTFVRRRVMLRRALREEFGIRCRIAFVEHHLAHIASAYFTSGFRDATAISVDGGGDGKSSLVYRIQDGQFRRVHATSAYNSLGNYYAYITHICGFKAMKHEGKITGLAAYGEPRYVRLLRDFIDEQDGLLINRSGLVYQAALAEIQRRLPQGWTREDLAASVQRHFEDAIQRYVGYWVRSTGLGDLALAGGVFANVRVNEEVHRLPWVDRLFVHPGMGDGGLPVGAALAACIPGLLDQTMPYQPAPLGDVYLGMDLTEREIDKALQRHGLTPLTLDGPIEEHIADLLARGYVVARANGRMEYGPRALGNRSILYQPTDRSVNDWLNKNLRRTEFMPFAPSVLYEERERCFERMTGAEHTAEFMTITFHCTPWMRERMQGVVHLDGTARPHLVRYERNPSFYRIIEAFHRRTGLPAIINTSFNMHEEPIVCSADDAVRAFLDGNLDYLALGPHLIKHPRGITHELCPVAVAEPVPVPVQTGASA